MRRQLEERLRQLKAELQSGQQMLAELETKQTSVRETMLRISGAIQVLEEELTKVNEPAPHETANKAAGDGQPASPTPLSRR